MDKWSDFKAWGVVDRSGKLDRIQVTYQVQYGNTKKDSYNQLLELSIDDAKQLCKDLGQVVEDLLDMLKAKR